MSKNTKIIAIVGAVLILAGVIYIGTSKGGFGAAFEAVGCGGKKEAKKPRKTETAESREFNDCRGQGYVCQRDDKGKVVKKGSKCKADPKKGASYCNKLWVKKCADANFKKAYSSICTKKLKAAPSDDDDDDDDDDE